MQPLRLPAQKAKDVRSGRKPTGPVFVRGVARSLGPLPVRTGKPPQWFREHSRFCA
jgi:hypothetical protein